MLFAFVSFFTVFMLQPCFFAFLFISICINLFSILDVVFFFNWAWFLTPYFKALLWLAGAISITLLLYYEVYRAKSNPLYQLKWFKHKYAPD